MPSALATAMPAGVELVTIDDLPEEWRRVNVVRLPGAITPSMQAVVDALRHHAAVLADGQLADR